MHCNNCGNPIANHAKFCTRCGAKAPKKVTPTPAKNSRRGEGKSMKQRRFNIEAHQLEQVLASFKIWVTAKGFNIQQLELQDGTILCQLRKKGNWRKVVGLSVALNVIFCQQENSLVVKIGAGKWIDKAIPGLAGLVYWPIFIPAGLIVFEQMKLPSQIFKFIKGQTI